MYLMLKKLISAIATGTVVLAIAPAAQAADNLYFGADFSRMTDKGDQASAIHPLALAIKGGVELTPNFAIEGRYGAGVKSDDTMFNGMNLDLKLDYVYGLYAKGKLPLAMASPYVLLGYSKGKETASVKALGLSMSAADHGVSFGIGVDIPITNSVSANAEWARVLKGTDSAGVGYKIEALTVGVALHF
jgi:opacity protein-like surface antigen